MNDEEMWRVSRDFERWLAEQLWTQGAVWLNKGEGYSKDDDLKLKWDITCWGFRWDVITAKLPGRAMVVEPYELIESDRQGPRADAFVFFDVVDGLVGWIWRTRVIVEILRHNTQNVLWEPGAGKHGGWKVFNDALTPGLPDLSARRIALAD